MANLEEIGSRLMTPGSPFELWEEEVLGERMQVFRNRLPSLRAFLEQSRGHGDLEYLVYEGRRISYAEHLRAVASVAAALREQYGVGRGDRVAIVAANCPEWIVTFWAATSLGAILVGLNGWWSGEEIRYGVQDCNPKLLIGDTKRLARLDGFSLGVPVLEIESDFARLWSHDPDAALPEDKIDEDDPACILYTSGTTGRPKGAVNTHRGILAMVGLQFFHGMRVTLLAQERGEIPQASGDQPTTLITAPLFHVAGLYGGAVSQLGGGARTVWHAGRFDPLTIMELIERERILAWSPMGTMATQVMSHPRFSEFDLSSLRLLGSGGAPLSPTLLERMRQAFPNARSSITVAYGLTEGTAVATLNSGDELERHPDSVGKPLPTVQLEVRDPADQALPESEYGEVHLRGPLVMREYWRNPAATAQSLKPGRWLATGDIGRIESGRLYIDSRARDPILRSAENIYPVEIEHRLEAHPSVRESAVVGVDHPELGQEVKAIVVPEPGAAIDVPALAAWVGETLAAFKIPTHWEVRDTRLPRNATGKILKHVLVGEAKNPFVEE